MRNKKAHIYYTMFISFISVLLNCFINLYLTPKVTNTVGIEAYGFVSLAKNFVLYVNIVMTALNSYAARFMSIAYLQGFKDEFKSFFSTVFIADLIIGGLIFIVGLFCIGNINNLLNISPDLVSSVRLLFLLTFSAFYLTTISTVFLATGYVKDRLDLVNMVKGISYIIEIIVLIFCYFILKPSVWYVGLATFAAAFIVFLGTVYMTKKLIPDNQISIGAFSIQALKKLVINGIWNSANNLGNALNSGLDLIITNLMLNAVGMGQISVAKTISNLIYTIYATISQPFQPSLLQSYSSGDKTTLVKELRYVMKVCGILTNVIYAGFCIVGLQFYKLWIPTQNIELIYVLTVLSMLPCITEGCMYPLYYVYTLTVKNRIPCIITIIGGLLNVLGMVILLKFTSIGIYSIVITTAVIMNFINLVTNPLYISHCLKLKKTTFYPDIIMNIIACGITIISFKITSFILPCIDNWFLLIGEVVVYGIIGIVLQAIILLRPSELINIIYKVRKRLK